MEKQEAGAWHQIGYTGPGTASGSTASKTNVINYSEAANNVWTAVPVADLNDCTTSMSWTITPGVSGTKVQYVPNTGNACVALTPSWSNFSRASD